MPAYSTNAAKLLACALAFSVIKHRFQIDMYGFFPFFRNKKKSFSFVCFWCTGNSQVRMVWKKVCISQSSSPHLWITSRNYRRASKMNMHDLVKLILFILVKLLSPSLLSAIILLYALGRWDKSAVTNPSILQAISPANIRTFLEKN